MNDDDLDIIDLYKPAGIVTKLIKDIKSKNDLQKVINASIRAISDFNERVKRNEDLKKNKLNKNVNNQSVDSVLLAQQIKEEIRKNEL